MVCIEGGVERDSEGPTVDTHNTHGPPLKISRPEGDVIFIVVLIIFPREIFAKCLPIPLHTHLFSSSLGRFLAHLGSRRCASSLLDRNKKRVELCASKYRHTHNKQSIPQHSCQVLSELSPGPGTSTFCSLQRNLMYTNINFNTIDSARSPGSKFHLLLITVDPPPPPLNTTLAVDNKSRPQFDSFGEVLTLPDAKIRPSVGLSLSLFHTHTHSLVLSRFRFPKIPFLLRSCVCVCFFFLFFFFLRCGKAIKRKENTRKSELTNRWSVAEDHKHAHVPQPKHTHTNTHTGRGGWVTRALVGSLCPKKVEQHRT